MIKYSRNQYFGGFILDFFESIFSYLASQDTNFYIAQIISILNGIIGVITMQMKKMELILVGQLLMNLAASLSFLLLGGSSGGINCAIAILHTALMFVFQKKDKKPPLGLTLGFLSLYLIGTAIGFVSLQDWSFVNVFINALSGVAAVCYCMSVAASNPKTSRLWYVFNPVCWMIYDIPIKAFVNLVVHTSVFVSTFTALIKTDKIFSRNKN